MGFKKLVIVVAATVLIGAATYKIGFEAGGILTDTSSDDTKGE